MASSALQIADALYAEDRDAKTLAQRVAAKLESDGVTNLPLLTPSRFCPSSASPLTSHSVIKCTTQGTAVCAQDDLSLIHI